MRKTTIIALVLFICLGLILPVFAQDGSATQVQTLDSVFVGKNIVLKGKIVAQPVFEDRFSMKVTQVSPTKKFKSVLKNKEAIIMVNEKTKFSGKGKRIASIADLEVNCKLTVKAKVDASGYILAQQIAYTCPSKKIKAPVVPVLDNVLGDEYEGTVVNICPTYKTIIVKVGEIEYQLIVSPDAQFIKNGVSGADSSVVKMGDVLKMKGFMDAVGQTIQVNQVNIQ